jgi:hypothetical protein
MADIYSNRQPVRTYPFLRAEGSVAQPVTGQNQTRALNRFLIYNLGATSNQVYISTQVADANGNIGSIKLDSLSGSSNNPGDAFVLEFDVISITMAQFGINPPQPANLVVNSLAMQLVNNNAGAQSPSLYANSPIFGQTQPVAVLGWDFAPVMRAIRYDDYEYIDSRTKGLRGVTLDFFFTLSSTPVMQVAVAINLRYQVKNLLTVPSQNGQDIAVTNLT